MNTAKSPAPAGRSLAEWLTWQEALNPAEIDLGLARVADVFRRMAVTPPELVVSVAGTNGKGSCAEVLAMLLNAGGRRTGLYTSPHLHRYNERIRVAGAPATDAAIVQAFEQVEAARDGVALTYFEFGTLAALQHFHNADCAAWVLEVGLGGRLDAVNIVDADVAVVTTVDLDHQQWLGDTVEQIAAEKAGILRAGKPAFYGDLPVPKSIVARASELGAPLHWPGDGFSYRQSAGASEWRWQGAATALDHLPLPPHEAQLANQAVALAALEVGAAECLDLLRDQPELLTASILPGRLQHHSDRHHWLLDVGHNPQAADVLRESFGTARPAAVVVGMMADKNAVEFAQRLDASGAEWFVCPTFGFRAADPAELAARLTPLLARPPVVCETVAAAMRQARATTPPGELIVVTGSFGVVGPALQWLGLY